MKKLLFCTHKVNKANIRRENRDGVEHIILTSFTLPPEIVMNGGLYPTDERDKSFESLNRTPVTIEHPEINGQFVSANDPEIDMDYRFGAWNENAQITDDNRISLDKVINVQKALKVERGKRLLDRIKEVETNDNARPIHTSVGVYLEAEETELSTNDRGQEYNWIARNMSFDHDAILLDSIGASTPDQGTGIGVNKENIKVEHYVCSTKKYREVKASNLVTNDLSFTEIEQQLYQQLNQGEESIRAYPIAVYDDYFIYETESGELFQSNYFIDEKDNLGIQDTRLPVERVTEYRPINPTETTEDNAMRESIIEELAKMGITVNADISDAEIQTSYKEALTANSDQSDKAGIAEIVENAVKETTQHMNDKISGLEADLKANSEQELKGLAAQVVNSGKYPALEQADIESLGIEKVKAMAANCGVSHGIGSTMLNEITESEAFKTNVADLPE